jgi:hypothetical protein
MTFRFGEKLSSQYAARSSIFLLSPPQRGTLNGTTRPARAATAKEIPEHEAASEEARWDDWSSQMRRRIRTSSCSHAHRHVVDHPDRVGPIPSAKPGRDPARAIRRARGDHPGNSFGAGWPRAWSTKPARRRSRRSSFPNAKAPPPSDRCRPTRRKRQKPGGSCPVVLTSRAAKGQATCKYAKRRRRTVGGLAGDPRAAHVGDEPSSTRGR